jgi:hypothetical protein
MTLYLQQQHQNAAARSSKCERASLRSLCMGYGTVAILLCEGSFTVTPCHDLAGPFPAAGSDSEWSFIVCWIVAFGLLEYQWCIPT